MAGYFSFSKRGKEQGESGKIKNRIISISKILKKQNNSLSSIPQPHIIIFILMFIIGFSTTSLVSENEQFIEIYIYRNSRKLVEEV